MCVGRGSGLIDVFVLRRRCLGNDWVLGGTEEHYIS